MRTLGIQSKHDCKFYESCIDTLSEGYTISIDIGEMTAADLNDSTKKVTKYFLNEASFGASGEIMKAINSSRKIISSGFTYNYQILKVAFTYRNTEIEYRIANSTSWKGSKSFMGAVTNGQYFGCNIWVNPNASIVDGKLDLMFVEDVNFLQLVNVLTKAKRGEHLNLAYVRSEAKAVEYELRPKTESNILIECDGELSGKLPAVFKSVPKAISLVVPKQFAISNENK